MMLLALMITIMTRHCQGYEGLFALDFESNVEYIQGPFPEWINPEYSPDDTTIEIGFDYDIRDSLPECKGCFNYCCGNAEDDKFCNWCKKNYWYDCKPDRQKNCNCNCACKFDRTCPDCTCNNECPEVIVENITCPTFDFSSLNISFPPLDFSGLNISCPGFDFSSLNISFPSLDLTNITLDFSGLDFNSTVSNCEAKDSTCVFDKDIACLDNMLPHNYRVQIDENTTDTIVALISDTTFLHSIHVCANFTNHSNEIDSAEFTLLSGGIPIYKYDIRGPSGYVMVRDSNSVIHAPNVGEVIEFQMLPGVSANGYFIVTTCTVKIQDLNF